MKTRSEQIDELQQEIWRLEAEDVKETQTQILPLLQKHATCHWDEYGSISVTFSNDEIQNQVSILVEGKQNGMYHYGCKIAPEATLRFDDGEITLRFEIGGPSKNIQEKSLEKAKQLGLNLSFDSVIAEKQTSIKKLNEDIDRLMTLKKIYENS